MIQYSFIIPVREINDYIRESVPKILRIPRADFEIIIYPDKSNSEIWEKTRQIATGPIGPAAKRSLAIHDALGEILIFIDDDAYPESNFLDILSKDFADKQVAVVGGPAVTPPTDSFWQKVSGAVFLSKLSGGCPERYVPIGQRRFVDDWPSVNLSARQAVFASVGGFDCDYWPGEDTKLCLDILKKTTGKILYDPELIVYHHRREGLLQHLKQVGGYGLHRGFFAKRFPRTSFKFKYFVPSFFLLFVCFGLFIPWLPDIIIWWYFAGWLMYLMALLWAGLVILRYEKNAGVAGHSLYYIFFTQIAYGWKFLKGFLFTRELKSELK